MDDIRNLFNVFGNASALVGHQRQIKDLEQAIAKIGTVCGDCDKWMKSSECPAERPGTGKFRGVSVGPSMNGAICKSFVEKPWDTKRREDLKAELATLIANPPKMTPNPY
jgi:hypothetical protein